MTNFENTMKDMSMERLVNMMVYTSPCDFCDIGCNRGNDHCEVCEEGITRWMNREAIMPS